MQLTLKIKLVIAAKVAACVAAAILFVSFTALFVIAPIHQHYLAYERQKLLEQVQKTTRAIDEVNEIVIRLHRLYREIGMP